MSSLAVEAVAVDCFDFCRFTWYWVGTLLIRERGHLDSPLSCENASNLFHSVVLYYMDLWQSVLMDTNLLSPHQHSPRAKREDQRKHSSLPVLHCEIIAGQRHVVLVISNPIFQAQISRVQFTLGHSLPLCPEV